MHLFLLCLFVTGWNEAQLRKRSTTGDLPRGKPLSQIEHLLEASDNLSPQTLPIKLTHSPNTRAFKRHRDPTQTKTLPTVLSDLTHTGLPLKTPAGCPRFSPPPFARAANNRRCSATGRQVGSPLPSPTHCVPAEPPPNPCFLTSRGGLSPARLPSPFSKNLNTKSGPSRSDSTEFAWCSEVLALLIPRCASVHDLSK